MGIIFLSLYILFKYLFIFSLWDLIFNFFLYFLWFSCGYLQSFMKNIIIKISKNTSIIILFQLTFFLCFNRSHDRTPEELELVFEELLHIAALSHLSTSIKRELASIIVFEAHAQAGTICKYSIIIILAIYRQVLWYQFNRTKQNIYLYFLLFFSK